MRPVVSMLRRRRKRVQTDYYIMMNVGPIVDPPSTYWLLGTFDHVNFDYPEFIIVYCVYSGYI